MSQENLFFSKTNKGTNYSYKGKKNESNFPKQFIKICKFSQTELKKYLSEELAKYYPTVNVGDGYVYVNGTTPVCLTAHMDTVHTKRIKDFYGYYEKFKKRNIISSPQGIGGDDRCGVYMILNILETTKFRPSIVFCEDEEIGGVGSEKFCKTNFIDELSEVYFFIELDRGHGEDLVFYHDGNEKFQEWCEEKTGYFYNTGSFSDICNLCPVTGRSGVNISCGYYNAHTNDEYVVLEEMLDGIEATKKLLSASRENIAFEYVRQSRYGYGSYNKYYNDNWYDSLFDDFTELVFTYNGGKIEYVEGKTEMDCIGQFLFNHPNMSYNEIEDVETIY